MDARSEYYTSQDDGTAEHRINQYVIRQEIGRGSFGAVHVAVDQFGNEYVSEVFFFFFLFGFIAANKVSLE